MTVQILVSAATHRKAIKGELIAIFDEPHTWGNREVLPDYVIVRVTGATKAQVDGFMKKWTQAFDYSVDPPVSGRKQITAVPSPNIVAIIGAQAGLKLEIRTYLEDVWGAIVTTWNSTQAIFTVLEAVSNNELKLDVNDKFEERFGPRYLFSEADVDTAVVNGGSIEVTKAQAQARIIDRAV